MLVCRVKTYHYPCRSLSLACMLAKNRKVHKGRGGEADMRLPQATNSMGRDERPPPAAGAERSGCLRRTGRDELPERASAAGSKNRHRSQGRGWGLLEGRRLRRLLTGWRRKLGLRQGLRFRFVLEMDCRLDLSFFHLGFSVGSS